MRQMMIMIVIVMMPGKQPKVISHGKTKHKYKQPAKNQQNKQTDHATRISPTGLI